MRKKLYMLGVLLPLASCASWRPPEAPATAKAAVYQDSVRIDMHLSVDGRSGLKAARWHLLRALEAQSVGRFEHARQDLDQAFHILAELETDEAMPGSARRQQEILSAAIEDVYFEILPHLKRFSPDSPLLLLLEGLSEEKIEELPQDATQMVRIHQLRQHCDVPIDANAKVAASIHFFQTRGKETYATWLQRAGRYRTMILDILKEEGVPQDLFYIAMIESGFNPRAYSRAKAVGLWQFIASTGHLEGLKRTHWIDERRDPVKSTWAAARHLKKLYEKHQDWRLVAAAYNAGSGRVTRAIEKAGTRNFWELKLPRETTNYVPLLMAAAIIGKAPELFGFEVVKPDSPLSYAEVKLKNPISLKAAAKCTRTSLAQLRELNPELRRVITPPRPRGFYRLRIPPGKSQAFFDCYAGLPESEKFALYHYNVQPNDSIWSIARDFGVSSELIIGANDLKNPDRIFQGQQLYIPLAGPSNKSGRGPKTRNNYTIKPGDTLSSIAQRHGVSVAQLQAWNQLDGDIIHPGKNLKVGASETRARPATRPDIDKKGHPFHVVQPGETLWSIGHRFVVDVEDLKKWNRLSGSLIHPGQKLIVGSPDSEEGTLYTVAKGDTLYSIARKFGLQVEDLARQNSISLTTTLLSGMTLKIKPLN